MATCGALCQSGVWEQVNQALGKQVRLAAERDEQQSLGLIDSQSVEMAQKGVAGAWRLPPGKEATLRDLNKVSMATRRSKDASGTWLLMC